MKPFKFLEDAEIWMDENASGTVCVLIKNPQPWSKAEDPPSRWEVHFGLDGITNEIH